MIVKFKTKWNYSCDSIADFYNRQNDYFTKENQKTKYILEKISNLLISTIPRTYKFISMCNYYQAPSIKIFKKNILFDYKKRNFVVCSLSIATSIYYNKGFFRSYIGLSALICRENLNARNYKFKMLPSCTKKCEEGNKNENINIEDNDQMSVNH